MLENYEKAHEFARACHRGQTYGSPIKSQRISYIVHIEGVFAEVEQILAQPDQPPLDRDLALTCALLHDTLEDSDATPELIAAEFGQAVANGVLALTKDKNLKKFEQMPESLGRIRLQSPEIAIVKIADRICSLAHPPHFWSRAKIASYQEEAVEIHAALAAKNPIAGRRLVVAILRYQQFIEASNG
jgi:guanosine-3',5'-bis(diphosphate) 3'-pyrophosphohydrolase